ncbi:MAG: histidine phosphatase family protein [Dehalococcoidia bacterium]|jgi:broad specificity phosphatase PhoE|uniref:histidine phosphatase family protein n=1 Tax=Candidatus Amarobacter glycogenicus TaxID=3140699 RepID=UPI001DC6AFB5|nr:histidine phosphatase family protein [Dehalococcoidia bacterium]MBK6563217.1 histidine phosphatase family protein [Dehalococcoidia bacterium]MBK7126226.1 histidine phosphatase family protein [Dehalococcoidia bacterium]MBK7329799.1 histidine phosphatase family protein [Dehalococcoidia bacterium]MBK7725686.1 histidine phosphatase family protein [Dehalococcoidia bacterium]
MPTTVFLVRHAETFGNIEGRFCGHSETELTPKGVEQAQALGRRLRGQRFDAAYSSDLSRAHRTALYALEHHAEPIEPVLDPGLREMHYGEWESLKGGEIGARDPDLLREFFRCKVPAPGGESVEQVRARTAAALRRTVEAHPESTLLVVSHGNAIMAMIAELLNVPNESSWSFAVTNTSITRLIFSKRGRMTLAGFNDHSHLDGDAALAGDRGSS